MTGFLGYIENFIDRIKIPLEAKHVILDVEKRILSDERLSKLFSGTKMEYMNGSISLDGALEAIGPSGKELEISEYTLHFIFLIYCTDILLAEYRRKNVDEQIFWDTMDDFRCKLLECHDVMEVWGTFVAKWYDGFLKFKRFALGRFQYEEIPYKGDTYEKNGILLNQGDKVYNFHVPSSGKAFDRAARIDSYRKAYDFFSYREKGGKQIFVCTSWLLYKGLEKILPGDSRIIDFIHDFDIVKTIEYENFEDGWRIFGKDHKLPPAQLPTDTSLRKAVAEHLSAGGKMGMGHGIIVFDGERIVTG